MAGKRAATSLRMRNDALPFPTMTEARSSRQGTVPSRSARPTARRLARCAESASCARLARRVQYAPQRMDLRAEGSRMEAAT
jgi:hypothetical protein